MASCSTYLSDKLLDHVFGKVTFTADDDLEIALYSVAPNSDGSGGTELPNTGGYARFAFTNDTTSFPGASARQTLNDITLDFENDGSAGDWLPAVAFKIFDSSGNVYTFGRITPAVTVRAFQLRSFPISALIHNLT
jgi:hypothetical protein